jgi:UDP-MurNAc hydroxylase
VDFLAGRVEEYRGGNDQPFAFRFDIARDLLERVIADRAFDWSNSLLLSCRFSAWRAGDYNESLYSFLKSLSVEKMNRTEAEALMKSGATGGDEADVRIGDHIVQRRCPHRDADLAVFGEIDGCDLVCTLHGWRFDLETGACRTAEGRSLRIRRAEPGDPG